jgi:hypothetical protein
MIRVPGTVSNYNNFDYISAVSVKAVIVIDLTQFLEIGAEQTTLSSNQYENRRGEQRKLSALRLGSTCTHCVTA